MDYINDYNYTANMAIGMAFGLGYFFFKKISEPKKDEKQAQSNCLTSAMTLVSDLSSSTYKKIVSADNAPSFILEVIQQYALLESDNHQIKFAAVDYLQLISCIQKHSPIERNILFNELISLFKNDKTMYLHQALIKTGFILNNLNKVEHIINQADKLFHNHNDQLINIHLIALNGFYQLKQYDKAGAYFKRVLENKVESKERGDMNNDTFQSGSLSELSDKNISQGLLSLKKCNSTLTTKEIAYLLDMNYTDSLLLDMIQQVENIVS